MIVHIVRSLTVLAVTAGLVAGPTGPAQARPLPAAGAEDEHHHVQCGDVLTESVQLHHDLACPGDGLTLGADGVTVDLNDHTISGPATATGIDTAGYDNANIRRGVLDGFGLVVRNSGHVTVHGVTAPSVFVSFSHHVELRRVRSSYQLQESEEVTVLDGSIAGLRMGFLLEASIVNSRVTGEVRGSFVPGVTFAACWFDHVRLTYFESAGARFLGNTAVDSSFAPVDSDNVVVERNRFVRSSVTAEIRSRRMVVRHNEFRGGTTALAIGDMTPGVRIEENLFVDNDFGVQGRVIPPAMAGLVVRANVFRRNRVAGLYLTARLDLPAGAMTFAGNLFVGNGHDAGGTVDSAGRTVDDGLHLDGIAGEAVVVRDNLTVRNADHGIEVAPGPVTDGGGNVSVGDPSGCLGVTCS